MSHQSDLLEQYQDRLLGVFGAPSLALVEGYGCRVSDANGKEYLDLLAGIAVNSIGWSHPVWARAVSEQAHRLGHVSNFFTTPEQVGLAAALREISGAPPEAKVFFTNSGTESNEAALKLVRAHGNAASPARRRILALEHAFHGRSAGALAVTAKPAYREPFEPLPGGVEFIPPTVQALEAAMDETVAGLILEPIQGEAGVRPLPSEFLLAARRATRQAGALLVVDEVQTGMGRTGWWLEFQRSLGQEDLPDVVTLAKGLGGGFPVGAMLAMTEPAVRALGPGQHGTTFGGNPLAMAAGLATIRVIREEGLLARARELGEYLRDRLAALPEIAEVRGEGLMVGADLAPDPEAGPASASETGEAAPVAPELVAVARSAGFLVNATGPHTLRLVPPLVIERADLDEFLDALPGLVAEARRRIREEREPNGTAPEAAAADRGPVPPHPSTTDAAPEPTADPKPNPTTDATTEEERA